MRVGGESALVGGHAGMDARQIGEDHQQDKRRMGDAQPRPQPPFRKPERVEEQDVDEGDPPAVQKMNHEPDHLGPVTIRRDHLCPDGSHAAPG